MLAKSINILSRFLGRRDIPELTQSALQNRFGFSQADKKPTKRSSLPA